MKNPGTVAYEAFKAKLNELHPTQPGEADSLLPWNEIHSDMKIAWMAAATAVIQEVDGRLKELERRNAYLESFNPSCG